MRLWSIHTKYLDCKGLVALWRESLLAKKVLLGKTKAYKKHPQLERFSKHSNTIPAINAYLYYVYEEGLKYGYDFKKEKISFPIKKIKPIEVTKGQILFEFEHLKKKLKTRDAEKYRKLLKVSKIELNPLFKIVNGQIERWEKTKES
jgi:hypothetical protein